MLVRFEPRPADVGQGPDVRQVVGVEHRPHGPAVEADHRGVEDLGLLGARAQVVEDRLPVHAIERGLAAADGLGQVVPAAMQLLAHHDRERPQGARAGLAEGLGQRIEPEAPIGLLGKDADARQGAEDPIQRPGRHAGRGGQFLGRPRAVRQSVGNPELRGEVDRPRGPAAGDHLGELLPGMRLAHVRLPFLECPHGR